MKRGRKATGGPRPLRGGIPGSSPGGAARGERLAEGLPCSAGGRRLPCPAGAIPRPGSINISLSPEDGPGGDA